tara:strand:- start:1051 stop:1998 length:948 start_codon:yes stop_codon:yes gene_type:complete
MRIKKKCPHSRQRSQCKDCGGSEICEHNRQRSGCKDCGGVSICEHDRQRRTCRECGDIIKKTIDRFIGNSKQRDKHYNRLDMVNFIDRDFCQLLIEESNDKCCYCLVDLEYVEYGPKLISIERINNNIGHIKGNVKIACLSCNSLKMGNNVNALNELNNINQSVYMTLTTKKIVKPKTSKSGKRELPVESVDEPVPEPVPDLEEEEIAVEQSQEDIPLSELIGESEPVSESAPPPVIEKKKRVRKPKAEIKDEIPACEEPVDIPTSSQVLEELVLPEPPAQEELLFNYDKTKVFNPATKRWCKVDSKAGKKVAVV